jgi:hypothetical protein
MASMILFSCHSGIGTPSVTTSSTAFRRAFIHPPLSRRGLDARVTIVAIATDCEVLPRYPRL